MGALTENMVGVCMSNGCTTKGHSDDIVGIAELIVKIYTVSDLQPLHKCLLAFPLFITSEKHERSDYPCVSALL